ALLWPAPEVAPGPEPGRSLYRTHCAECHGPDGRGRTWHARLLLLRPGDLTAGPLPDRYLQDIIRHGGASFGKPGMPSFGFPLSDAEIAALVEYVQALPRALVPDD
ncbi:MAG: c-type cytochrome, partial [Candidatus Rokuibacteriota bacterium]